jgi:hypothetical protein
MFRKQTNSMKAIASVSYEAQLTTGMDCHPQIMLLWCRWSRGGPCLIGQLWTRTSGGLLMQWSCELIWQTPTSTSAPHMCSRSSQTILTIRFAVPTLSAGIIGPNIKSGPQTVRPCLDLWQVQQGETSSCGSAFSARSFADAAPVSEVRKHMQNSWL